jgi:cytochrome c peroxidase
MNGREPTVMEMAALAAFVEQIKAPPAIPGVDFDPAMAALGEQLFREPKGIDPLGEFSPNVKISCETCHVRPLFTDNKPHRILGVDELIDPGEVDEHGQIRGFDTPPLKGLRFTAPYFHQNAAGDPTAPANLVTGTDFARRALRDNVLNFYNARFAFNFTPAELDALTEFLLSL